MKFKKARCCSLSCDCVVTLSRWGQHIILTRYEAGLVVCCGTCSANALHPTTMRPMQNGCNNTAYPNVSPSRETAMSLPVIRACPQSKDGKCLKRALQHVTLWSFRVQSLPRPRLSFYRQGLLHFDGPSQKALRYPQHSPLWTKKTTPIMA